MTVLIHEHPLRRGASSDVSVSVPLAIPVYASADTPQQHGVSLVQVTKETRNRRWSHRSPFEKPGIVSADTLGGPIECQVRNLTKFGAMVDLLADVNVPDCFVLVFFNNRIRSEANCVVRWRSHNRIGVCFAGALKATVDRRKQER